MNTRPFRLVSVLVAVLLLVNVPTPTSLKVLSSAREATASVPSPQGETATRARVEQAFSKLPLYFIENRGQLDARVAYYISGSDKTIYFTSEGVTFALTDRAQIAHRKSHIGKSDSLPLECC